MRDAGFGFADVSLLSASRSPHLAYVCLTSKSTNGAFLHFPLTLSHSARLDVVCCYDDLLCGNLAASVVVPTDSSTV